jgi:hypothetical protein
LPYLLWCGSPLDIVDLGGEREFKREFKRVQEFKSSKDRERVQERERETEDSPKRRVTRAEEDFKSSMEIQTRSSTSLVGGYIRKQMRSRVCCRRKTQVRGRQLIQKATTRAARE